MISFVIPAYNEELLLGRTLDAIHDAARAVGRPYEVIVADDASTDGTAEIAGSHGARVVSVSFRQIAATRNAGAHAAAGELLIFVDADTIITAAAVQAAVNAVQHGAVGGGTDIRFDGYVPLHWRILLRIILRCYRAIRVAPGCFLFCTRDAFQRAQGFDETLFGAEECFLSRALGRQGRFVILREPVVTSGRKLRTYSTWELVRILMRLTLGGTKSVRRREGMEIWYGERRPDPESVSTRVLPSPASNDRMQDS